jgi:hypothetical protein
MDLPFQVVPDKLNLCFTTIESFITDGCGTETWLAFENIDAIMAKGIRNIVLITDGDTDDPIKLTNSISALFQKYPDVQLTILTVEPNMTDYGLLESTANLVGNKVWEALKSKGLTQRCRKFVSYTLRYPNGFTHINTVQTPKGFVPAIDGRYFSLLDTPKYMAFINQKIYIKRADEMELLKIVQSLASTLNVLTQDQPVQVRTKTFDIFYRMFEGTALDAGMVQFLVLLSSLPSTVPTSRAFMQALKRCWLTTQRARWRSISH